MYSILIRRDIGHSPLAGRLWCLSSTCGTWRCLDDPAESDCWRPVGSSPVKFIALHQHHSTTQFNGIHVCARTIVHFNHKLICFQQLITKKSVFEFLYQICLLLVHVENFTGWILGFYSYSEFLNVFCYITTKLYTVPVHCITLHLTMILPVNQQIWINMAHAPSNYDNIFFLCWNGKGVQRFIIMAVVFEQRNCVLFFLLHYI